MKIDGKYEGTDDGTSELSSGCSVSLSLKSASELPSEFRSVVLLASVVLSVELESAMIKSSSNGTSVKLPAVAVALTLSTGVEPA